MKNSRVMMQKPVTPPQKMGEIKASAENKLNRPTKDMSFGFCGFELLSINLKSKNTPAANKEIAMPEQSANIIHRSATLYCNPMNQLIIKSKPSNPEFIFHISEVKKSMPYVIDFSRPFCNIDSKLPEKIKTIDVIKRSNRSSHPN